MSCEYSDTLRRLPWQPPELRSGCWRSSQCRTCAGTWRSGRCDAFLRTGGYRPNLRSSSPRPGACPLQRMPARPAIGRAAGKQA